MTQSSLSLASTSSSEFYVLSEVDTNLRSGLPRLSEDSISKLRSKIETQKRKVSDVLSQHSSSSFISTKENDPLNFSSTRKVAKLSPTPAPYPSPAVDRTARVELPSRKIAPNDPSVSEETRPKRIIGRTDPSLPVSHVKTRRPPIRPPVQEKPKQKLAKPEKQLSQATLITPYSWRRGQALVSQLLRPKSRSEGSLSSSALSASERDVLSSNEYAVGNIKFRTILEDNGLTSFDKDSLNLEAESELRYEPDFPLTHLPLDISSPTRYQLPPSPERTHPGLCQSAPNLKQEGRSSKKIQVRQITPEPATPPKVRHYERKNIQEYMQKQKETRKDKRRLENEEKERSMEVKKERLNHLYLKQKIKLQKNLVFVKAKELNIPRSYFSPVSSETFIKNTPIDIFSLSDTEPPLSDAPLSPPPESWASEDRLEDSRIDSAHCFPSQDMKTDFEAQSADLSPLPEHYLTESTADVPLSPPSPSSPPLPPPRSTRIEKIRLAALTLKEKLDQDYQRAGRELASVSQIPGIPSYDKLLLTPTSLSIARSTSRGQSREYDNELSNMQRELEEDIVSEGQNPEEGLAPLFLTRTDKDRRPEHRSRSPKERKSQVVKSLSETDWKDRTDGDPMSVINIYTRRHTQTLLDFQPPASKGATMAIGVQTFSPDRSSLGVDTFSLKEETKDAEIRKMLRSRSKSASKYPPSSVGKKHSRHRKSHPRDRTAESREGSLLENQMRQELQMQDTLDSAQRQLLQVEKLTSQISSQELLSEYQTKINRQKAFYEEQIKLLASRVEKESVEHREFHQLSPLTESAELELGEKIEETVEGRSLDVNALSISPENQDSFSEQLTRPAVDSLTQEIGKVRQETSRAVIEMAKNSIEADQKIFTSTPSVSSHIFPPSPPTETHSHLEGGSTISKTYSEDFNSESVLSTHGVADHSVSGHSQLNIETDYDRQVDTLDPTPDTPLLSPVKQLPPVTTEDSLLSISDMSFAYTSETEQLQQDKIFQMLLPSKSHRRHSARSSPTRLSRHDTSTDSEPFLLSSPRNPSKTKEEDSFQTFLEHMVSSFIKRDRERAKHQEMLLGLTERAIEDKTKMQLKWLGKKSEYKGVDLKRPSVQKLKRDILTRHEREFEEVKRLKHESLSATREQEQDFMRTQHRMIKKLRQSTQYVQDKIDRMGSGHSLIMDDLLSSPNHSSLDVTSSLQDLSRAHIRPSSISTSRSLTARSLDKTADDSLDRTLVRSPVAPVPSSREVSASLSNKSVTEEAISERGSWQPSDSKNRKSLSSEEVESSDGNTLKDTESIFTDTGDSPTKSPYKISLIHKADSHNGDLPSSPKQVSFTETYSEHTDVVLRVASLEHKLSRRKHTVRQLKFQLKRKHREDMRTRELLLKQQLETIDRNISEAQQKLGHSYSEECTPQHTTHTPESYQAPTQLEEEVSPSQTSQLEQTQQQYRSKLVSAASRTESISEQLATFHTPSHSEEEENSSASTETGERRFPSPEQETAVLSPQVSTFPLEVSLMSSQGSPEVASSRLVSTVLYSDTFLTSLGEDQSPPAEQISPSREEVMPLHSMREEREKLSDSLSTVLSTQLLSELDDRKFEIGDDVVIRDSLQGTVRYSGPTSFADGVWIGVELREPVGTNNGSHKGVKYFECDPKHGIFVKPTNLSKVSDSKESSCVIADSSQHEIIEETFSHHHFSLEPLLSIVSDLPPDRSITVFSESESAGTAADEQLRWSGESGDVTSVQSPAPTRYDAAVQQLLAELVSDAVDTCVSVREKRTGVRMLGNLTAPWINTLVTQWADESVSIYLDVKSTRLPMDSVPLLSIEEVRTPEQISPVRTPSPLQPPPITSELDRASLVKIADSALVFYRDRLAKQRPLDIEQLQFSRRSDTIIPIAFNVANSPTRQAHHQIFRHFLFDLSYQVLYELMTQPKQSRDSLQPPKKQRSSFQPQKLTYKKPKSGEEVMFVADRVSELAGYGCEKKLDRFQGNTDDPVEHLLIKEMREEEPGWIEYSEHEYFVKLETSDSILYSMLEDALELAQLIKRRR